MNPSTTIVEKRILKLLQKLEQHEIDVYLVPSMDEHLNEFVPEYKQRLKAITGFSGSAGNGVVLPCRKTPVVRRLPLPPASRTGGF